MSVLLLQADARQIPLADGSVDCVVTSPPYWGLRDYGVAGQIGLESLHDCLGWATGEPCGECWVCHLLAVFREVHRVLKPTGTCWVNLGDSYAANHGSGATWAGEKQRKNHGSLTDKSRRAPRGLKPKDICGQPWRFALAMQAAGWWLRSEIIWAKPSSMPESVQDRPGKSHEQLFLLTKSPRYFYDQHAVQVKCKDAADNTTEDHDRAFTAKRKHLPGNKQDGLSRGYVMPEKWSNNTRKLRTVWPINPQGRPEAHFATFPEELARRCILLGTSARGVCPECGQPWKRDTVRRFVPQGDVSEERGIKGATGQKPMDKSNGWEGFPRGTTAAITTGWLPGCDCGAGPVPAVVLDPFVGSGTVCRVAETLGRRAVGLDLSGEYLHGIAQPYCAKPVQRPLLEAC